MSRNAGDCAVITLWENQQAIDHLEASALYSETVQSIMKAGFLTGDQRTEVYETHLFAMDDFRPILTVQPA